MEVKKVKKNTVVRQVMDQIKNQIATGVLNPGDRIPTETVLAEQFGTGRSTIREAIKIFEYLGIIESHTRSGTYVCDHSSISTEALTWAILLGKNELFELVDLRSIIEQRALEIVIEKAQKSESFSETLLKSLEQKIVDLEFSVKTDNLEDLIEADYGFHGAIIHASDNNVFIHIYQTLKAFMHEEIKITNKQVSAIASLVSEHKEILQAIRDKDIVTAKKVFYVHIHNTINQLISK